MKPRILLLVLTLAFTAMAQQPNSANASMTFDGIDGPSWPIILPINVQTWNPDLTIDIGGPPLQPFLLAAAPAGVLGSGISTPFGQLDLNLAAGFSIVLDGTAPISPSSLLAFTNASGQWTMTVPLFPGTAGIAAGLQCLMSVPSSPSGFVLTAATHLTTVNVPTSAYFVSHSRGAPGNPGTAGSPFLTIEQGISESLLHGLPYPTVYVEHGSYTPTGAFVIYNGMSLLGGMDAVSWTTTAGTYTTVNVGATAVLAQNVQLPTTIQRLEIVAGNAAQNLASTALRAVNSASTLAFVGCRFQAGNGGPGSTGANQSTTASGSNGAGHTGPAGGIGGLGGNGQPNDGGNGGSGGGPGNNGANGQQGQGPGSLGGTASGGVACGTTSNAGNANNGAAGAAGPAGTPVAAGGIVSFMGAWFPSQSNNAANGLNGRGGGGGGGSGGAACTITTGNGGGGGGGGGAGGIGGNPGLSGGGSIAVTLGDSSPTFQDCVFVTAAGGAGGQGGQGGQGGSGGAGAGGGSAGTIVGAGGDGGNGGAGGRGGGGPGGNGGSCIGVAKSAPSNPVFIGSNVFNLGTPGTGGAGGAAPGGNAGQAGNFGLAVNVY